MDADTEVKAWYTDESIMTYVFYFLCALMAISLCAVVCLFNTIRLTVAVMEAASDFVTDTTSTLLVPIMSYVLLAGVFGGWLYVAIYLYSSGSWDARGNGMPFGQMKWDQGIRNMIWYHIFIGIWAICFILALT